MRKTFCIVLCAALPVLLSGCAAGANGREPEDTVLARIVGVDVDGQGVTVTAAGTDGEETVLAASSGATLEEAFSALPVAGDKRFSLTNVTHVLVGDGVELTSLLRYILDDPDMSYMAKTWAAGFAGGLMEDLREDGLGRFQILEESGAETITVKNALAGLLDGGTTAMPVLSRGEAGVEVVGKLYFEVR